MLLCFDTMGEQPRKTEEAGCALFRSSIAHEFKLESAHEKKADIYTQLRAKPLSTDPAGDEIVGPSMPVQLKTCKKRTQAFNRKMKFILNHTKAELHDVVLIGVPLDKRQNCFVHLVHKHANYKKFNPAAKRHNVPHRKLAARLAELWAAPGTNLVLDSSLANLFSNGTLRENAARLAFTELLKSTGVRYRLNPNDGDTTDGYLFLEKSPERQVRVQEKVAVWRMEKGQPLGVRVSLRRYSGFFHLRIHADLHAVLHRQICSPSHYQEERDQLLPRSSRLSLAACRTVWPS